VTSLVIALLVVVLAVACGGGDGGKVVVDGAFAKDKGVPTLAVPTTLADAKGKPCKPATGVKEVKGKPTVEMPKGNPPAKLEKQDLKAGTGAATKLGETIKVHYVGISCSTGKQFDSSWDSGQPADFELSEGDLIKGWTEGIPGMKVGGQRRLVIPGDLAYGAEGRDGIAPNEALVFVIDLLETKATPASTTTVVGSSTAPADGSTTSPNGSSTSAPGATTVPGPTTVPGSTTTGTTTGP